jgi:hypothetical protein
MGTGEIKDLVFKRKYRNKGRKKKCKGVNTKVVAMTDDAEATRSEKKEK